MKLFALKAYRKYDRLSLHLKLQLIISTTIATLFSSAILIRFQGADVVFDMSMGCILSLGNAFLGYLFIERAFRFQNNLFLVVSLAGIALRFFLTIVSIALILVISSPSLTPFVLSFMISYSVLLFTELLYINGRIDKLKAVKIKIR